MSHDDELSEILESIDMEYVLDNEGAKYKKTRGARGLQLNLRECPFCGSTKWKVYMNADSGLGNCFSGDCEAKFGKWSFIKAMLGDAFSVRDVVDYIKRVAREQGWRPKKRVTIATNTDTAVILPDSIELPTGGRNLRYLDNRGITSEIAKYFGMRYCHNGHFEFEKPEGGVGRQDYSHRVILPVFDLDGDLVTFQGRDITGTSPKKYLFPPGLEGTGSHIYNGHNAHRASHICMGEGAFDVAAIKIAFDHDSALRGVVPVGSFGKHLSEGDERSQLAKLMTLKGEGLRTITFMWDGEKQAIDDAIDAALLCRRHGFTARVAILPNDKDPNEVAPDVVRQAFWRAETISPATAAKLKMTRRVA
ncbi:DNA primase [Cupriavidus campinensis]|uniref:DNA primase n=1 Tax=Cupriavidus campinensis TaxID=151783 RepID=A0ABY3ESN0_9BURK|nr:DNA primase [Cupriavidus campinensis]TSP13980.1 DNA primase [Cupriavidus campinensis]